MCDPVTASVALAGGSLAAGERARDKAEDAAHDNYLKAQGAQAAAEREATDRANARIVATQSRRRQARGLLRLGLDEQGSLGPAGSPTPGQRKSLLSLGTGAYNPASAGAGLPGAYYGGSGGGLAQLER